MEKNDASTGGESGPVVDTNSVSYQLGMISTKIDGMSEKMERLVWRQDDAERRIEALEAHKAERAQPNKWTDKVLMGVIVLNLGMMAWMLRGMF